MNPEESERLTKLYCDMVSSDDPRKQEDGLESAEEAHYMDGAISYEQHLIVARLYAKTTGDYDILR